MYLGYDIPGIKAILIDVMGEEKFYFSLFIMTLVVTVF